MSKYVRVLTGIAPRANFVGGNVEHPMWAVVAVVIWLVLAINCAQAQERVPHPQGEFELQTTPNGVLIAAPHGKFDGNSGLIAIAVASRLKTGYLVASGFVHDGVRINVNRPTEGAGLSCKLQTRTEQASHIYEQYRALASRALGRANPRLYVEVHGNSDVRIAEVIEIATVGITVAQANLLKLKFVDLVAQATAAKPEYPQLKLAIEPLDRIINTASCAKVFGIMGTPIASKTLHIELPKSAREPRLTQASATLVAGLVQALLESMSAP